jgi:chemotaxis protein CheD
VSDPIGAASDPRQIIVGVGELACAEHPHVLVTQALGSCIGLALWDPMARVGGLVHVMLPTASDSALKGHPERFGSTAVPLLVRRLAEMGTPKRRIVARMAGGAAMFGSDSGLGTIGTRNAAEVRAQLARLGIPIRGEDTGGSHARTIELHLDTGILLVRSYAFGLREI